MRFQAVLAVWRIGRFALGDFGFVFVADCQEDRLGHVQVAFFLAVIFKNMRFHNRIGRTGLSSFLSLFVALTPTKRTVVPSSVSISYAFFRVLNGV